MPEAQTIESAVAAKVRQVRQDHSLTRDAVATTARKYGVTWSTGSVGNLEAGKMSMTLSTMLILAQALRDLTGAPFALADLIGDADPLQLTPSMTVPSRKVRAAMSGESVSIDSAGRIPLAVGGDSTGAGFQAAMDALPAGGKKLALLRQLMANSGLAEQRAAAAVGISVDELTAWSGLLWGTTLSAERDRRTGPDASAQKRGHVTRQLVDEIRDRRQALTNG